MNTIMTIQYDEYLSLINVRDTLRSEIEKLKNDLYIIRNMKDEVLIIHKDNYGNDINSYRKPEKNVIGDLCNTATSLQEKIIQLTEILSKLEIEKNSLLIKLRDSNLECERLKETHEQELNKLKNRSFIDRILNRTK